jgi:hypothetical protein
MHGLLAFVRAPGARAFLLILGGQLVSLVGSALTQFALGVWVYTQTGSPTQFVLMVLCAVLPRILLGPFAGALVDRWDRRLVLIGSDLGAALVTLALAAVALGDQLAVWHAYAVAALGSVAASFQRPAAVASVSLLLDEEHFARASGLASLVPSLASIVAPVVAGVLYLRVGLPAILLLDLASFLVAAAVLLVVRFPRPSATADTTEESLLRMAINGWAWLRAQPGLLGLLLVSAAANFLGITTEVLLTPYVLSFESAALLGWLASVGGVGLLCGSLVLTLWGGPRRLLRGVFGFEVIVSVTTLAIGLTMSPVLLTLSVWLYFVALSLGDGCATALWQRRVPHALQGRVFALREAIAVAALPLGLLLVAPLAEFVLEPRLQVGGAWADSLGALIGIGPGRGMALVFVVAGLLNLLVLAVGWCMPRIRLLDTEPVT